LVEKGVPLAKVSAMLGHSSINTTFEYYVEVLDENEHIIDFLNDRFSVGGD
jgi:site-specific recombinase XerD